MIIKVVVDSKEQFYKVDENQLDLICTLQDLGCFAENVKIDEVAVECLC